MKNMHYRRTKFIDFPMRNECGGSRAKISRDRVQIPCLLNIKSKKCWHEPNTVT